MTHVDGQPVLTFSTRRFVAGAVALLQGGLALGLAPLAIGVSGNPLVALIFLVFFGPGAGAAALHAFPGLLAGRPMLRVRPGTAKAVAVFFAASLHGIVAVGAIAGLFFADTLWQSVPMFFGTVAALMSISALFAASGYFLYALERLTPEEGQRG